MPEHSNFCAQLHCLVSGIESDARQPGIQPPAEAYKLWREWEESRLDECFVFPRRGSSVDAAGGRKLTYCDGAKVVLLSQSSPPGRHVPGGPLHNEREWYGRNIAANVRRPQLHPVPDYGVEADSNST